MAHGHCKQDDRRETCGGCGTHRHSGRDACAHHGKGAAGGCDNPGGPFGCDDSCHHGHAAAQAQPAPANPLAQMRDEVAREILLASRNSLMMSFRFLDLALWKLPLVGDPATHEALGTDGFNLYYNPDLVIAAYKDNPNEVCRDYLHSIMHCVFRQPFETYRDEPIEWEFACDLSVESVCLELCDGRYPCARDEQLEREIALLKEQIGPLTPHKVYDAMLGQMYGTTAHDALAAAEDPDAAKKAADLLARMRTANAYKRDAHERWSLYETEDDECSEQDMQRSNSDDDGDATSDDRESDDKSQVSNNKGKDGEGDKGEGEGSQQSQLGETGESDAGKGAPSPTDEEGEDERDDGAPGSNDEDDGDDSFDQSAGKIPDGAEGMQEQLGKNPLDSTGEDPSYNEGSLDDVQARADWKEIAERIQVDLETASQTRGRKAGNAMANLEIANRKQVDYREFLHQFATVAEDMRLNDDEFDYIFYTYGFRLYERMPLIEPLEYRESPKVREFVVAIDTSGSTKGALVRRFLERTCEILKETESFGDEVNIHIVQCDEEIQDDTVITDMDQLGRYAENIQVKGMGGTDFRPVFSYVNALVEQGGFENLQGLVYFTDGMGTFPDTPPGYRTAFVFVDEDGMRRRVPPWAMRVVMDGRQVGQI